MFNNIICKIIVFLFVYLKMSSYIAVKLITKTMEDLKTYKAIYSKNDMVIEEFEAENFDDAQGIAELKRPEGYETECVHQTAKSILKPLFEAILKDWK